MPASPTSPRAGRPGALLAIRSRNRIDWTELTRACADADIVVADRRLPRGCNPRWLKLDRAGAGASRRLAIYLGDQPRVATVAGRIRPPSLGGFDQVRLQRLI